jgi:hypothetical protein
MLPKPHNPIARWQSREAAKYYHYYECVLALRLPLPLRLGRVRPYVDILPIRNTCKNTRKSTDPFGVGEPPIAMVGTNENMRTSNPSD